jgi:hypothetical protein
MAFHVDVNRLFQRSLIVEATSVALRLKPAVRILRSLITQLKLGRDLMGFWPTLDTTSAPDQENRFMTWRIPGSEWLESFPSRSFAIELAGPMQRLFSRPLPAATTVAKPALALRRLHSRFVYSSVYSK